MTELEVRSRRHSALAALLFLRLREIVHPQELRAVLSPAPRCPPARHRC